MKKDANRDSPPGRQGAKAPGLCLLLAMMLLLAHSALAGTSTIVFMSDFGIVDDSVAICKGVMYEIAPDARIVDLTHQVTPYSILDGARFLAGASEHYPAGAVFVTVIDPGVGSSRKAIVARTKQGQYFVLPDNGLITLVEHRDGIEEIREIANPDWMIGNRLSSTFHGRDIFAPVAARLARGDDWTSVGPPVTGHVQLKMTQATRTEEGIRGEIIATDGPFGNLITNIDADMFLGLGYSTGEKLTVTIGERKITIPYVRTFSDVPVNRPLLYPDSRGHMALAINQGNFSRSYGIRPPVEIFLPARKTTAPARAGAKSDR